MKKLSALALLTTCCAAHAQTPADDPMPDGSRDMYVGLGLQSAPRYEGASLRRTRLVPALQIQWSNGIFVSGMNAGMHLSSQPGIEYGPLLALQPRRDESGVGSGAINPDGTWGMIGGAGVGSPGTAKVLTANRLVGMEPIGTRLLGGGFFNYYLGTQWRLTSSVLWGAGNDRHGGFVDLGVQRLAANIAAHHTLSFSAGAIVANRDYNQSYFGVNVPNAVRSGNRYYEAHGGLKDVHAGVRWNWSISPSWMVTTNVQATRLLNSAADSTLVTRPTNLTVTAAVAYRF
ncbi:MipA/OmpV family protein [Massilia terrae]|uniref:MipA/OmpV family protein n=1 Tax=Massilia terrae TaxID=1811224 RepID=A0ABT2CYQ3_9BURK|nr:MipA/OmpV family protein [Massilia terrae]MCS0659118.1 MipA/OmpV family protein [Massilia terrae]